MKESIESIAQWSRETFPDATLIGQLNKFKDEKEEWEETPCNTEDELFELADMFIVACSVARFSATEAMYCFRSVAEKLEISCFATQDLERAIDKKMEINRARKWCIKSGNYQHTED